VLVNRKQRREMTRGRKENKKVRGIAKIFGKNLGQVSKSEFCSERKIF